MKSNIIKGITLFLFSTLIIAFVAYRSGYFGGPRTSHPVSPNGSALSNHADTFPKAETPGGIQMLSSSKVIILTDHASQTKDSNGVKLDSTFMIDPMMVSSKSGYVFKAEDMRKLKLDSVLMDSLNKK
ncbi:MAG: hypothetical protein GC178_09375 [Flavobacteriales bacterium]|nr:hypothetical protein [Flavobacteriales bacterium]